MQDNIVKKASRQKYNTLIILLTLILLLYILANKKNDIYHQLLCNYHSYNFVK